MAVSLPEDVVLEILARLKTVPAALFRSATTCKRWRDLVADLSFLHRCWPKRSPFVARGPIRTQSLGRDLCSLSSFVPNLPARAAPLVSRHFLLLVRLVVCPKVVQLAVYNLQVGTCHMLPAISTRDLINFRGLICYALLTAADCRSDEQCRSQISNSSSSFYKVLIIGYHPDDGMYNLHTISSHETSWSVRTDCFETTALGFSPSGFFSNAVVRRGTAHWIFCNYNESSGVYLASLNIQTEHISLSKLAFPLDSVPVTNFCTSCQCLALANQEVLQLLRMQHNGPILEIWTQQEKEGTSEWFCTRRVELKEPGKEEEGKTRELYLLGEKCGTLLVTDTSQRVYHADLETGTMEMVREWEHRLTPKDVVPWELDWPTLFVSRLVNAGVSKTTGKLLAG